MGTSESGQGIADELAWKENDEDGRGGDGFRRGQKAEAEEQS